MKNFLLLLTILITQGCTTMLSGGTTYNPQSKSIGSVVNDSALEAKINKVISSYPLLSEKSHVNVTSYNGVVLLTGETFDEQIGQQIEQLTKNIPEVKRVENYLIIGRRSVLGERAFDATQTAKVKTALFNTSLPNFDPTKIKVVTEHGSTYLMGIVHSQEAKIAADITRRVSDVKEVISLFEVTP